jgi:nucleoside-diphosphate-sugar epimerase
MRAFVTGGSGFVGRALVGALLDRGDGVVALVRSDAAAEKVRGAEIARGDLDAVEAMTAAMRGCDVVFHAAAKVEFWGDPRDFQRVNVTGTANVIRAARAAGVPRLVHVGTEAVYADGTPILDVDETRPLPARPIGLYPATKGAAEKLVLEANGGGLATMVVRPRFIWGKGDTSLLPQLVRSVREGRFRWINGGDYLTSTCHIDNLIEGMLLAAERGRPGGVWFLTDGAPVKMRDFMTAMLRSQGVEPGDRSISRGLAYALAGAVDFTWSALRLKREPPIARVVILLMGDPVTVRDDLARRELGYVGRVSVEAGLAAMR